jgi:hypothetical protein
MFSDHLKTCSHCRNVYYNNKLKLGLLNSDNKTKAASNITTSPSKKIKLKPVVGQYEQLRMNGEKS